MGEYLDRAVNELLVTAAEQGIPLDAAEIRYDREFEKLVIEAQVVTVTVPGLHGPVHDRFVIPAWLDAELHARDIEHRHEETR